MDKETIGKIIFTISAILFLFSMAFNDKTDCQACELEWEGHHIDGYKAWEIYEDACISYRKPWEPFYINIDDIPQTSINVSDQFLINP